MKNKFIGLLAASLVTVPAWAGPGGPQGGNSSGSGNTVTSTSTANGGAGGAGGSATGGAATGGAATGGAATGGTATGNSSTVTVSLTTGSGSGDGSGSGSSSSSASGTSNTAAQVDYGGSYTVKSAPQIVAPSLTSTFSDTCMGSSSFGLSVVGFGATGGTTMVDEACVRRLDSREFRAMGMIDVALSLLCQSPANRKAVESTGRACPSASPAAPTASAKSPEESNDPIVRRRMGLEPVATVSAVSAVSAAPAAAAAPTPAAPAAVEPAAAVPAAPEPVASAPAASAVAPEEATTMSVANQGEPEVQTLKDVAAVTSDQ